MSIYYLIDITVIEKENTLKLSFFNSSNNSWKQVIDDTYRPYFFVSHPISSEDLEVLKDLKFDMKIVKKTDLFSGQTVKLAKIILHNFSGFSQVSNRFARVWEREVSLVSSYVYDKGLVFGGQHRIFSEKITPILETTKEDLKAFKNIFSQIRETDAKKYEVLKRFFLLSSQPIPDIDLGKLGFTHKVERDEFEVMFTLARIANMSVLKTYKNRRVSDWIKSIFHNYLRNNNILIPTAFELRRGEETHRVKGALTLAPVAGIHFNVVVVDFDSMYPSLIDSYNLSHETIDCEDKNCQNNKVPELLSCVCTNRRGVYSILVGAIKDLRIHWYKPRAKNNSLSMQERELSETISNFLKLILVSSYGVVIRIHGISRSTLGEAITAYGRYSLKTAYKIAKNKGLIPIYGDTDSLFLENPPQKEIDWLIKEVKEKLKLDLSVDVRYNLCVLPKAAKAYFGIRKDGTVDIKGLTAIKSNSPKYIQDVFKKCTKQLKDVKNQADFLEAKNKIKQVVKQAVKDLKSGKIPISDLEYAIEIHEDPKKKSKSKSLHQPYQAAIQIIDKGRSVKRWDVVHFIKVKPFNYGGKNYTVKPTSLIKNSREINLEDYIRNLKTALNQTFKPMDILFSDQKLKERTLLDFA